MSLAFLFRPEHLLFLSDMPVARMLVVCVSYTTSFLFNSIMNPCSSALGEYRGKSSSNRTICFKVLGCTGSKIPSIGYLSSRLPLTGLFVYKSFLCQILGKHV